MAKNNKYYFRLGGKNEFLEKQCNPFNRDTFQQTPLVSIIRIKYFKNIFDIFKVKIIKYKKLKI